jgi:hypothetical protein
MLEGIHTTLRFAQFVRQAPDGGSEHGKLGNAQQHLTEGGAGFIQNGCGISRAVKQLRRFPACFNRRNRHAHDPAQFEMDIHRLIDSESRPFHMIATHHQSGLFHGFISRRQQGPDLLLNRVGFLCDADEFGGERLTLTIEDFVSFPRESQVLFDADQITASGCNINVRHFRVCSIP